MGAEDHKYSVKYYYCLFSLKYLDNLFLISAKKKKKTFAVLSFSPFKMKSNRTYGKQFRSWLPDDRRLFAHCQI